MRLIDADELMRLLENEKTQLDVIYCRDEQGDVNFNRKNEVVRIQCIVAKMETVIK